jgi:hypothetical protein
MFSAPRLDVVTPRIHDDVVTWFNNGQPIAQGEYLLRYEGGLMRYGNIGYSVNDPITLDNGFCVRIDRGPGYNPIDYVLPGTGRQSADPQIALSHNIGIRPFQIAYRHLQPPYDALGVRLGVFLRDVPYTDNTVWTVPPQFSLTAKPYNANSWPENTQPYNVGVSLGRPRRNNFQVIYDVDRFSNPFVNLVLTPPWVDVDCIFLGSRWEVLNDGDTARVRFTFAWTDPARPAPERYNISWGDVWQPRTYGAYTNEFFEYKSVQLSGYFQ